MKKTNWKSVLLYIIRIVELVITGAAGGIGEATTRRIVSEGGKVVIADHSKEKAEQLAAELTQSGG